MDYWTPIKDFLLSPSPQVRVTKFLYGEFKRGSTLEDNSFSDWLYGEYDEKKLRQFELLHNVPIVSNYMDYLLDVRADKEYMDRYGLVPSDIHDSRKLRAVNSGSRLIGTTLNYVSKNVTRLYR